MKQNIVHALPAIGAIDSRHSSADVSDRSHANRPPAGFDDRLAISILDAANALGCGRSSVYTLIAERRLETIHLGRRHLVLTSSIVRLVEEARHDA